MHVVATAGHVDHGKSALVRALTGTEPDRWEQERRRGMTIDLGYAWTTLDSGEQVAFVDVPGHQRFIGNMLAGIGPAPAVVFVVAADEGWRQQSEEHLAAIDALGLEHGLLVITRSDLADSGAALAASSERLAASSLGTCEALAVSARTGLGMTHLRYALDRLVSRLPTPVVDGRVRLWIDRSFTIRGSGTVVTGTLGEGTVAVGDQLVVGGRTVTVRGLQSLEESHQGVSAVARVALNLRGIAVDELGRGDALLTPGAFTPTLTVDVRLTTQTRRLPDDVPKGLHKDLPHPRPKELPPDRPHALPTRAMLHVGTAAIEVHLRPLSAGAARLTLPRPLPLRVGDRAILRDPGQRQILGGVVVADVDPPALQRRGAAARRGEELAAHLGVPDLASEVGRRGALRVEQAIRLGLEVDGIPSPKPPEPSVTSRTVAPRRGPASSPMLPDASPATPVTRHGDWLVGAETWTAWHASLSASLRRRAAEEPLEPSLTLESARALTGIPHRALLLEVAKEAGLQVDSGRISFPGAKPSLGVAAEAGMAAIEAQLAADPFAAPEARDLEAAGLGPREIAAAERLGRVLRLPEDVLLLPTAPARAMRLLAGLPQPFTTSDARQALGSTRRVVIPLLEHLDGRGWTRRLDGSHREVKR